mgnify:FL=1
MAAKLIWETGRLYENEDILVIHNILVGPDGTKEAVIVVHTLKDGKMLKTETGTTPVK